MTDDISDKDKTDWNKFINSSEKIFDKDNIHIQKNKIKTKTLDLHGYTLDDANKIVSEFIKKAYLEKVNKLMIITGKGIHSKNENNPYVSKDLSILKYSVPEFILNDKNLTNLIYEIKEAKVEDGGGGAFYIYLKKK